MGLLRESVPRAVLLRPTRIQLCPRHAESDVHVALREITNMRAAANRSVLRLFVKLLIGCAVSGVTSSFAQPPQRPIDFEVASIRPSPVDPPGPSNLKVLPGGRFKATRVWTEELILSAFGVGRYLVKGGPDWLMRERYDIDAKAITSDAISADELKVLLQSLLISRFHLKAHRETKEMPYLALVVARGGFKLKAGTSTDAPNAYSQSVGGADDNRPGQYVTSRRTFVGRNVPLSRLAGLLSRGSEWPVEDETGVAGAFDFSIESDQDEQGSPTLPLLNSVLQDRLGLRLELRHRPMQLLVIDSITRPSPN